MTWTISEPVSPVPAPAGVATTDFLSVNTDTACLALIDTAQAALVWEDLLYHGSEHGHGDGGLMLNRSAVGTQLEHDGDFPVVLLRDGGGRVVGVEVDLDPYAEDLDSLRRPSGWTDADEQAHDHGRVVGHGHSHDHDGHSHDHDHDHSGDHGHSHGDAAGRDDEHGHYAEGWSHPASVTLVSEDAVFGNPAGLPDADDTGGLLDFQWPAAGGVLTASVFTRRGVRRRLVVAWSAA